jgi:hypothetical protein
MTLSGQLRTLALEIQGLLPTHLDRWQAELKTWSATDKGEMANSLLPARLTMPYRFALLAAVNDRLADEDQTAMRIEPWANAWAAEVKSRKELEDLATFGVLKRRLDEIDDAEMARLVEILGEVKEELGMKSSAEASPVPEPARAGAMAESSKDNALSRLVQLYTGNIMETRLVRAAAILNSGRSLSDRLTEVDNELKIPPTASAGVLGRVFGATKQAVQQTEWWRKHRREKREERVEARRDTLIEKGRHWEHEDTDDGDDN